MKTCPNCLSLCSNYETPCIYCSTDFNTSSKFIKSLLPQNKKLLEGYDAGLYPKLFELEKGNFWFDYRNKIIFWTLQKFFPSCQSFIEVGCGTGFVLEMLKNKSKIPFLYGSDLFKEGLEFASKRVSCTNFYQLDLMEKIPFSNEFDGIGAFDVLEHIKEDFTALENLYKACKSEGGIIITVPQHQFLWSLSDEIACHYRRYKKNNLISSIEKAGFKVCYSSSFISLLFPLMFLSRLFPFITKKRTVLDELEINFILNVVFKIICNIELIFLKLGVKFPFGGSLIIVAKK